MLWLLEGFHSGSGERRACSGEPAISFGPDELSCGLQHEPVTVEREDVRVQIPEDILSSCGCFLVRSEVVYVGAIDTHQETDHRHAQTGLEPLAQVVDRLAGDANAGFVSRLVDDGLFGGFAVIHVPTGEAPLANWRDGTFHGVRRVVIYIEQYDARHRRRLDPPRVRRVRIAAGELVPVVLAGVPVAERVVAQLVAPERDEAGVDSVAAFEWT